MRVGIAVAFLVFCGQSVFAQQAVQQPVVGTTSVSTSVQVPDRGRTFMGGVSSAQSGRSQYGPLRSGTSSGFTRQNSSISVSVHIHDLQAMDEELLRSAPSTSSDRVHVNRDALKTANNKPLAEPVESAAQKATKFEQLARQADAAGKPGVARLHWQMAAKYGSRAADKRLAEISSPTPGQPIQAAAR